MRRTLSAVALAVTVSGCAHHESRVAQVHSSALMQGAFGGGFAAAGIVGGVGTALGGIMASAGDTGPDGAVFVPPAVLSLVCLIAGVVLLSSADATLLELPSAEAEDEAMRAIRGAERPAPEPSAFDEG